MSGSVRDTQIGAYVETEQYFARSTQIGLYAETELRQLDVTTVGMYVEVEEDEMIYDTVMLPEGVGALYQNIPLVTITRR